MSAKSKFKDSVVKGGIAEVKRKLKHGIIKRDEPVDLEKELRDAKAEIGSNSQVHTLGITDDDLRDCIVRVSQAHKLSIKLEDGTIVPPSKPISFMDKMTVSILEHSTPSPRGALFDAVKSIMKNQAIADVKKGTVVVPVDVEGYATRIENKAKKIPGMKLSHDDYVIAIREICDELSLEVK